ncbi:hypothetical protein DJ568_02875 [Mucilaginibacter hurinus]|uniref:Uncharacterized protein n=1 Tax=Mucilaginibacter hurinus TaxID=2201324 RepID=A0A367GTS0_9SPHI|nr:hypothetical protein [Mucilaginibacter hurinus]RCH56814.1 hypothetical protein DJ568_02875 [Mucilaginibacter hurinus]
MNHSFEPFWAFSGNRDRIAREYFYSLANLCAYFQLSVPQTDLPFPQNIYDTWEVVAKQVSAIDPNFHCQILQDKRKKAVLSVIKTFDLSNCLFYIPVRAYWNWSQTAEKERITELVTVIFAYLHQVVEIPFYAESGTFLDYQYDTLEQWIYEAEDEGNTDEEEKGWRKQQEDTIYEMRRAGGHIMPVIKNPAWLTRMEEIVLNYHHRDKHELEWELLAIEFLQLYRQYPNRSISDGIHPDLVYPYEEERIRVEEYTHFYWSDRDCFQDELMEMINCSFQERPVQDEPTAVHFFDTLPDPQKVDFDFETRLFGLIERLRDLLDQYDHEKYHGTV